MFIDLDDSQAASFGVQSGHPHWYSRLALLAYVCIYLLTLITAELPTVIGNAPDLVLPPSSSRIKLTKQHDLVQLVVHASFEFVYISLLSVDTFPDGVVTIHFAKDMLLHAARRHMPCTASIYQ